jgi:hypothetical protein
MGKLTAEADARTSPAGSFLFAPFYLRGDGTDKQFIRYPLR